MEESRGERSGANDPEEVVVGVECLVARREEPSWWQHSNDNHASTAVLSSNQQ